LPYLERIPKSGPVTLKINWVHAVVKVHVRAKFHQAMCSDSRVSARREKNSDENNKSIATAPGVIISVYIQQTLKIIEYIEKF